MIFEVLVLDGGDGVVEDLRGLLVGHEDAALQREAADHLAVIGVNFRDYRGAIGFEGANFGQVAGVDEEKSAGRAECDGAEQQEAERDAVNEFEAAQAQGYRGKTSINRKVYRRWKMLRRGVRRGVPKFLPAPEDHPS